MLNIKQFVLFAISLALGSWMGLFLLPKLNPFVSGLASRMAGAIRNPFLKRRARKDFLKSINNALQKRQLIAIMFVLFFCHNSFSATCPGSGTGNCWYVRSDGGSRYNATNLPTGQCNGLYDVSYASTGGSGTNQNCAYNDVRYLWADGSSGGAWAIAGGDTVIVRGGPWRIGSTDSNGDAFNSFTAGGAGQNNTGTLVSIPNGTSGQHTRILGENYQHCSANYSSLINTGSTASTNYTQLFGGFGLNWIVNFQTAQFVDFQCIEITDHNNCVDHNLSITQPSSCGSSAGAPPYTDFAYTGIRTDNTTHDVLFQDMYVHGLVHSAFGGAIGANITMTRVAIQFNGFAGYDFSNNNGEDHDNGAGSSITATDVRMYANGCNEEYPIVDAIPATYCYDTGRNGFGDGWSGQDASLGTFTCIRCRHEYNTKDPFIGPHVLIGTLTMKQGLFIGNEGEGFKFKPSSTGSVLVQDTIIRADCMAMSSALSGWPSTFNTYLGTGSADAFCRADGAGLVMEGSPTSASSTIEYDNNTFVAASMNVGFDINCTKGVGTATIVSGGTGYQVNDVLNVAGEWFNGTVTVTAAPGGVISTLSVTTAGGGYEVIGTTGLALSGGHGTGATVNITQSQNSCTSPTWKMKNNIFLGYTDPNTPGWNSTTISAFCYGDFQASGNCTSTFVTDAMWGSNRTNNVFFGFGAGNGNCTYMSDICSDPLFTNEPSQTWPMGCCTNEGRLANFNFTITSGSPAKYAGVAIGGLTLDYNGYPWANPPSIGALEFGSSQQNPGATSVRGGAMIMGRQSVRQ